MKLAAVVGFLDETLDTVSFGADSALNGLQVEGSRSIASVCLAVDACEETIRKAARAGADLLIVHHGLFWGVPEPITGPTRLRVRLLLTRNVSLYAAHLPLDCHPELGNNAQLAGLLDLRDTERFGAYRGILMGIHGRLPRAVAPRSMAAKLRRILGSRVSVFPFGRSRIDRVGVVSGGGASLVQSAAEAECDALITGETSHSAYHTARESRINLICAGHYATETLGVRALGDHLHRELGLPVRFIDVPTGL